MADDVQGFSEVVDELVAVAKDHLLRVPVRVTVVDAKVDATDKAEALVIDGVAVEDLGVEVEGVAKIIVTFFHSGIMVGGGGLAFFKD